MRDRGTDLERGDGAGRPGHPRTFTLGFFDPRFDESRHAEAVAAYCGTRHVTVHLDDHELVDLCLTSQAARWSADRPKPVLRHIGGPLLPAATIAGGKRGFELPMGAWMQGPLRAFCLEGLDRLRDHRAVPDEVCAGADRALAGGDPRWRRVWQWVVLGHWLHAHVR